MIQKMLFPILHTMKGQMISKRAPMANSMLTLT